MPKQVIDSQKLIVISAIIMIAILLIVWLVSYCVGFSKYDVKNSSQNYGSIIQGMSALLAVVLAAAIFRIQSLENRLQSLEESTRDYVYKVIHHAYPEWDSRFEENIRNHSITNTYFDDRDNRPGHTEKEYIEDRDIQQEGLNHILTKHTNLEQAITRIKNQVMGVSIFLVIPILFSLLLLMSTDSLPIGMNFFMVSFMIYLSVVGIGLLIAVVLQSMIRQVGT